MKYKIKQAILKKVLNTKELKKLHNPSIVFPGGITPIHETQDQDVFIVGFPKSGNTLMQHLIAHLVYGINEEGSRSMVNLIVPDIYVNSHYFRFNDRCFFKSHDLPKQNYKKVIYIIRDGRDALLSYSQMMENLGRPVILENLYNGSTKLFGVTWSEHIQKWEENPYQADILMIRFEDLKTQIKTELVRISKFLNIKKTDAELEAVIKFSSLNHMKELETRQDWVKMKKDINFNSGSFVGKGTSNSYKANVPLKFIKEFELKNEFMLKKYFKR